MIELLPGSGAITDSLGIERFLEKARPIGRFRWYEDCGIHALIFTGDPRANIYNFKIDNPFSKGFFRYPKPGKQVEIDKCNPVGQVRIIYECLEEMRGSSLAEIVSGLISVDPIRKGCDFFEIGLPYQIGNRFASDITTYSQRQ